MAGLSTKAIKTRIKSMQSTRQITKAMELVAASKLRSAQASSLKASTEQNHWGVARKMMGCLQRQQWG